MTTRAPSALAHVEMTMRVLFPMLLQHFLEARLTIHLPKSRFHGLRLAGADGVLDQHVE